MSTLLFGAFIAIFYVIGFGLLAHGINSARRSSQAATWPTAPAKLTSLEVHVNEDSDGDTYEVRVRYAYKVHGVAYEGSRVAFGYSGSSDREPHDQIYERLKGATAVAVRYDPSAPAESCLSFGLHRSIQFMLVFATSWLLFVIGFTLLFWLFSRPDSVLLNNLSVR